MLIVRLRAPVLIMVLAATAIPVAFRPPQQPELFPSSIDVSDVLANIAGFVPVGFVLADLGPLWAVMAAALLSLFARSAYHAQICAARFAGRVLTSRHSDLVQSQCLSDQSVTTVVLTLEEDVPPGPRQRVDVVEVLDLQ